MLFAPPDPLVQDSAGIRKILGRCNSWSGKQLQIGKGNIESNSPWARKISTTSGTNDVDRKLGCRRGNSRFQPGFHLLMPDHSRLLRHEAPAAEDDEVWNASHVEPARYATGWNAAGQRVIRWRSSCWSLALLRIWNRVRVLNGTRRDSGAAFGQGPLRIGNGRGFLHSFASAGQNLVYALIVKSTG
jgi:hypothetical protein